MAGSHIDELRQNVLFPLVCSICGRGIFIKGDVDTSLVAGSPLLGSKLKNLIAILAFGVLRDIDLA